MADAHKYRTVYHDYDRSPNGWAGNVAVRGIGGGCTCGWQGHPRPDTADGGVQAFNDWWTDHYTPLVRPDPGELLILSHTGGMRCHYLAGRPVPSGTTLELRLSGRRWMPVRYEWSARADAAPRFYMELGGPWESFDEHGPETYVMLSLERTVFRWPVGTDMDRLPPALEPMFGHGPGPGYGPGPDEAFRRSLTPPPPSSMTDSLEFSSGRNRGWDQRGPDRNGYSHNGYSHAASTNSFGRDLFAEAMDYSAGRSRRGHDRMGDSLELPGSGRTYRLQPGSGGPPPDMRPERGMTDPFGFNASAPVSGRPAPPGYYPGPPAPEIEPRRPSGPPPGMRPSAGDSFAGRMGGIPMGNSTFVDGQAWDGHRGGDHGSRPRDGRPMDGRPVDPRMVDGRPMDRPPDGRPIDVRPMDGRPVDGRPMDARPMNGRPMDGRPMDGPPMRPPPGAVPELPPPGGDGPRRMRVGRPPSDFPGMPHPGGQPGGHPGGHPGMNGNGSHPSSNGAGGTDGGAASINDQVSRIMREATDEARRAARPYPGGPPEHGGHGQGHPRYQDYQGYPGHAPMHGHGGGEPDGPPEDPWRRPYDG